ncbi:TlpA family protein disulfide reductase [Sphingomonas sp. Tas61C01]|uniref:TlpA family protein disulfide reductase n=1 Tax=Sphingomonas sp. Tas61C01 TaxID=3458297 RepID=UPI00403E5610
MSRGWAHRILRARRSFFWLALATLGAADQRQESIELPPGTLLLLVAPWCAPCWGELAHVDALAKAAAPLNLRVLTMEDSARARAMTAGLPPERQWTPRAADRASVRAALWSVTPGLPFSVATDAKGRICAQHGGGLTEARALLLVKQCG